MSGGFCGGGRSWLGLQKESWLACAMGVGSDVYVSHAWRRDASVMMLLLSMKVVVHTHGAAHFVE